MSAMMLGEVVQDKKIQPPITTPTTPDHPLNFLNSYLRHLTSYEENFFTKMFSIEELLVCPTYPYAKMASKGYFLKKSIILPSKLIIR